MLYEDILSCTLIDNSELTLVSIIHFDLQLCATPTMILLICDLVGEKLAVQVDFQNQFKEHKQSGIAKYMYTLDARRLFLLI